MSNVVHPNHYNWIKNVECITVAQEFSFNLGNVIKYVWRAGKKDSVTLKEDLEKAKYYIELELARIDTVSRQDGN